MRAEIGRVSVAILAGGEGLRLGGEKAGLCLGGERLIDRALRRLAWLGEDRLVIVRRGQGLAVAEARLLEDLAPYEGPLAGLAAALQAARWPWVLVVGCDMPFIQRPVVEAMLELAEGCQAVVPRLHVGLEPLHALYHQTCLDRLYGALGRAERRLSVFLQGLAVRYLEEETIQRLDPLRRSFFNINTPQDLAHARALLAEEEAVRSARA